MTSEVKQSNIENPKSVRQMTHQELVKEQINEVYLDALKVQGKVFNILVLVESWSTDEAMKAEFYQACDAIKEATEKLFSARGYVEADYKGEPEEK